MLIVKSIEPKHSPRTILHLARQPAQSASAPARAPLFSRPGSRRFSRGSRRFSRGSRLLSCEVAVAAGAAPPASELAGMQAAWASHQNTKELATSKEEGRSKQAACGRALLQHPLPPSQPQGRRKARYWLPEPFLHLCMAAATGSVSKLPSSCSKRLPAACQLAVHRCWSCLLASWSQGAAGSCPTAAGGMSKLPSSCGKRPPAARWLAAHCCRSCLPLGARGQLPLWLASRQLGNWMLCSPSP